MKINSILTLSTYLLILYISTVRTDNDITVDDQSAPDHLLNIFGSIESKDDNNADKDKLKKDEEMHLQDFIDAAVDVDRFKLIGLDSFSGTIVNAIWDFFKKKFNRVYTSAEDEQERFGIFFEHLKYVLDINLLENTTYKLALNGFADWTLHEFNEVKKGLNVLPQPKRHIFEDKESDYKSVRRNLQRFYQEHLYHRRTQRNMIKRRKDREYDAIHRLSNWPSDLFGSNSSKATTTTPLPRSFDWRTKNVVSSVKYQRHCGCCYAFATTTVLESAYAIKTKKPVTDFSPQQLVDCSAGENHGCNGGEFASSMSYFATQNGSIATFASYPYAGKKQTCKTTDISKINLGNVKYSLIRQGDEKGMAEALVKYGPVFMGLYGNTEAFMFYKSGVLDINNCSTRPADMDHAMVVVGYGYDETAMMPYWTMKNSWGLTWGENGYIRVAKDKGNMCGVASVAGYAIL